VPPKIDTKNHKLWRGSHAGRDPYRDTVPPETRTIISVAAPTADAARIRRVRSRYRDIRPSTLISASSLSRSPPFHDQQGIVMSHSPPLAVEEHVHGDTVWVALRSRGADWSWLTPDEAVELGRRLIEKYSPAMQAAE
jgi:hypothetical protein